MTRTVQRDTSAWVGTWRPPTFMSGVDHLVDRAAPSGVVPDLARPSRPKIRPGSGDLPLAPTESGAPGHRRAGLGSAVRASIQRLVGRSRPAASGPGEAARSSASSALVSVPGRSDIAARSSTVPPANAGRAAAENAADPASRHQTPVSPSAGSDGLAMPVLPPRALPVVPGSASTATSRALPTPELPLPAARLVAVYPPRDGQTATNSEPATAPPPAPEPSQRQVAAPAPVDLSEESRPLARDTSDTFAAGQRDQHSQHDQHSQRDQHSEPSRPRRLGLGTPLSGPESMVRLQRSTTTPGSASRRPKPSGSRPDAMPLTPMPEVAPAPGSSPHASADRRPAESRQPRHDEASQLASTDASTIQLPTVQPPTIHPVPVRPDGGASAQGRLPSRPASRPTLPGQLPNHVSRHVVSQVSSQGSGQPSGHPLVPGPITGPATANQPSAATTAGPSTAPPVRPGPPGSASADPSPRAVQRLPVDTSGLRRLDDVVPPSVPHVSDAAQAAGPLTDGSTRALLADRLPLGSATDLAGSGLAAMGVPATPAMPVDSGAGPAVPELGGAAGVRLPIRTTPPSSGSADSAVTSTDVILAGAVVASSVAPTTVASSIASTGEPAAEPPATTGGPGPDAVAATAGAAATGAAGTGGSPAEIDVLAQRLYEPIARRLRAELRVDRERMGRLVDRPW
jgi:hypothetical protein